MCDLQRSGVCGGTYTENVNGVKPNERADKCPEV